MEVQTLQTVKPAPVRFAIAVLWLTFSLFLTVGLLIMFQVLVEHGESFGDLAFLSLPTLLVFGIYAALVWKVAEGRNWARIVYLAFAVAIYLPLFLGVGGPRRHTVWPPAVALGDGAIVCHIVSLVLIFIGPARRWFGSGRRVIIEWK